MSISTQKKFLQHVQDEAEVRNLVMVEDKEYANIGTVRFQRMESFTPILTFGYDFQTGYATFTGDLGTKVTNGGNTGTRQRLVRFDDLDQVMEDLRGLLPGGRRKAQPNAEAEVGRRLREDITEGTARILKAER